MGLELSNVVRTFGVRSAVDGLSFQLPKGSIGCLLGPSGCGKTTALRCIAGFEPVDAGVISAQGRVLSSKQIELAPADRRIGMVFQDFALFPHLTVAQNVRFGLQRCAAAERKRRADEMIEIVGLAEFRDRYPHQLSGGQQQRVALARALAPQPELVLLDEPFSSLDVELRERLSIEVRDLLKQLNTTTLLVTHDQQEAFAVADLVGVMRAGKLEQWDAPQALYHQPATRFVADFIGQGVFVLGTATSAGEIETEVGRFASAQTFPRGASVQMLLRPDDVLGDESSPLRAIVTQRAFRGSQFLYTLQLSSGLRLLSLMSSHSEHAIGSQVGIRLQPDHVVAFAAEPAC